ncbi:MULTISPECIES: winged helix-turn-helix domain-containing protein [unclassified Haloferax]|uniref:helix-turn-helix transcriptional regulator n=1 Tax=unclassified Haloferax TaxID=2625095 RepID=UPI0002B15DA9|nr:MULTISPECIES: transcriptional regulator FilR1 domain-containing protein [unclassified Haloferax]ELZ61132.1 DNA binding protein [Haloferax sp. ATCC BAA-645]ELZ61726.1 DNA binding protein [Haloferax sp. ATCC BAA-646]ELZ71482.1 DNA binding protein [Haloferax sp. ATCC BAA-644]
MESALDEIEFLALSQNRVDALRYLAERPHSRRELVERTGASQPTMGRILSDFEDRSWLVREDGAYRATVTGELVSRGFDDLVDILDTDAKLRPVVEWLPTDAITFDLEHLTEATITTPSQVRPNAPVKRAVSLLSEAEDVRIFSYAFNEQNLDIVRERTAAGDQRFEGVFSSAAIDALAHDSQLREQLRDLLNADAAAVRITDEPIPMAATIADTTVHLFLRDDNGILQASIDVTEPEVLAWADDLFERYWEAAEPLDLDRL